LRLWVSGASKNERTHFALSALRKLQAAQADDTQVDVTEKRTQVLYFFCNRHHDLRNTASSILKSWIHQLLQQWPDVSHIVRSHLQSDTVRYLASDYVPALSKVLRQFWRHQHAGKTYCIIDGLDECDEKSVSNMVRLLSRMFPKEGCRGNHASVKVMVTCGTPSPSDRFRALDLCLALPEGLGDNLNFRTVEATDWEAVMRLLRTTAALRCPPTVSLLASVLKTPESEIRKHVATYPEFIHLHNDTLRFTDAAVVDYLHIASSNTHYNVVSWCLTTFQRELAELTPAFLVELSLSEARALPQKLQYAVQHWAKHVHLSDDSSPEMMTYILTIFHPQHPDQLAEKWWRVYCMLCFGLAPGEWQGAEIRMPNLLARFGLHKIITVAHNSPFYEVLQYYLHDEDSARMDALEVAVWKRDLPTIQVLLTIGSVPSVAHVNRACRASIPIFKTLVSRVQVSVESARVVNWLSLAVATEDEQLLATVIKRVLTRHPGLFPIADQAPLHHALILGLTGMLDYLLPITDLSAEGSAAGIITLAAEMHEHDAVRKLMADEERRALLTQNGDDVATSKKTTAHNTHHHANHSTADPPAPSPPHPTPFDQEHDSSIPTINITPPRPTTDKIHLINALTAAISNNCISLTSQLISPDNILLHDSQNRTPLIAAAESANIAFLPVYLKRLPPGFPSHLPVQKSGSC
jgi:hypothetical protein